MPDQAPLPVERIDRWLWAVRLFKTRAQATQACRDGEVEVGCQPAKPSRDLRVGDAVEVRQGLVRRTLIVRGFPRARVGPKLVAAYCEDKTSAEEFAKARAGRVGGILLREKGAGRPTKRDRRALDQLFGFNEE
jgi:ribosome-associated heat shock protein Hsp15